jgi:hypothetical protein
VDRTRSLGATPAVRRSRFSVQPCLYPDRVHFSGFSIEPSPRFGTFLALEGYTNLATEIFRV